MKKSTLIIHGTWFCASVVAFGLGYFSDSESVQASASSTSQSSSSQEHASGAELPTTSSQERLRSARSNSVAESSMLHSLFGSPSNQSIEVLARVALSDPNQVTRRLAFSKLLEAMTPENAEQIRQQLVELGADRDQWRDFNYSWGAIAGKEAFASPTNTRDGALADTLAGWAAAKPEEALAMFENLPAELESKRAELTRGLINGLADSNRILATDMVLRLSQQGDQQAPALMSMVAQESIRGDGAEAAAQWSDSLPDGPLKGAAMSRIAEAYARSNPEAAADWALRYASQDFASAAIERISGQWTAQNPQAAVSWLESLPAGKGQNAGLQTAFNDWEDRDPVAASQYLLAMPNSPLRDTSISGFSSGYAWQNPQAAIQWASSISDAQLRQRSLTHAGQVYFRQNPTAAREWLTNSGLAPEIQQQITNPPRR